MNHLSLTSETITLKDAPHIPHLTFRHFRGESDYPAMVAIINGSKQVDQLVFTSSVEDTARHYRHLLNCDPFQDMIFAEVAGDVVGYGRVWWEDQYDGTRLYLHIAYLLPEWRNKGIRQALVHWNENRLREIGENHPIEGEKVFQVWVADTTIHWETLIKNRGYTPIRYSLDMVRPNLDDIPDLPLPAGLELRPADLSQWRQIFNAAAEAFRDHWGAGEWAEEEFQSWQADPTFDPSLWQVAWDADEIAGGVLTFIDQAENAEYGRQRGYTETIFTRRPWRRQGLARALIARSLQVQKEQGITESALTVDAENLTGALQLYISMGFQIEKRFTRYRKPLEA